MDEVTKLVTQVSISFQVDISLSASTRFLVFFNFHSELIF